MSATKSFFQQSETVSDEEYQAIMTSLQDIKEGRYEDYNIVFDRVEKKLLDAMLSNRSY